LSKVKFTSEQATKDKRGVDV